MNINGPNFTEKLLEPPVAASTQAIPSPRPIMVSGQQPQAMLPISSSVSNTNPPIDFTSLQPPPMETTLMSFASSQNQQIIQGKSRHLCNLWDLKKLLCLLKLFCGCFILEIFRSSNHTISSNNICRIWKWCNDHYFVITIG